MRGFVAFIKKEFTEQLRTGKLFMLAAVFALFGIMNPAVAKLTPWMMEQFAESLAQTGISITEYEITAFDSWLQFYKNLPLALIGWVLFNSNIFTREYRTGTLILSLTKGFDRYKAVLV